MEHDITSYSVLKRVEVEFCGGTRRWDTWAQSWIHTSKCHPFALFLELLAICQPGHGDFACLHTVPEGLGSGGPWKWRAWGAGLPHKIFRPFHPSHQKTRKRPISVLLGMPSSPSGFLLRALRHQNGQPQHLASVLNIVSKYHIYVFHNKFHLNTFQCSVRGDVRLDAITYGNDST